MKNEIDRAAAHVIVRGDGRHFQQEVESGKHRLVADEPIAFGGADAGLTPYDLLLAALGSCTSMTIGLYARRKQWPLEFITVSLWHDRVHAKDCEDCLTKEGMLDQIEIEIEVGGKLDDEQRARLVEVAAKCPVHRTLTSEVKIRSRYKTPPGY